MCLYHSPSMVVPLDLNLVFVFSTIWAHVNPQKLVSLWDYPKCTDHDNRPVFSIAVVARLVWCLASKGRTSVWWSPIYITDFPCQLVSSQIASFQESFNMNPQTTSLRRGQCQSHLFFIPRSQCQCEPIGVLGPNCLSIDPYGVSSVFSSRLYVDM